MKEDLFYSLIYDLIEEPEKYVRKKQIELIYQFLYGYQLGVHISCENPQTLASDFWDSFRKWLVRWIQENIDTQYPMFSFEWYEHIKKISKNDEEACEQFFKLVKQFLAG